MLVYEPWVQRAEVLWTEPMLDSGVPLQMCTYSLDGQITVAAMGCLAFYAHPGRWGPNEATNQYHERLVQREHPELAEELEAVMRLDRGSS